MIGFGPGRTWLIARMTRLSPQRLVLVEEPVKTPDPLIGLGRKEFARDAGYDGLRRHFINAGLLPQVAPEQGRPVLRDRVMNEGDRAWVCVEVAEQIRREQLAKACSPGQSYLTGAAVAARGGGNELVLNESGASRVEQRAEHRLGRESSSIQRQRLEDIDGEQPAIAEVGQHIDEQACGLANQGLVPRVMLGDVVPSGRRPVRTLDQEAEERLLLRREEHHQRRAVAPD